MIGDVIGKERLREIGGDKSAGEGVKLKAGSISGPG